LTGGKDGIVKVWNKMKELLREIKFPEPITSVAFMNANADILIGHGGKVSKIMAPDFKPLENFKIHSQQAEDNFRKDKKEVTDKHFL
jgi:hypothetical protein